VALKLNKTYKFLVYADDVNLLGDNLDTINENRESPIDAGKEVGRKINTEKTKHTSMSPHQNAGKNHDIKIANSYFENMAQFKYLGATVTNQNFIKEEVKTRLNSGNASYHYVRKLLFSRLLSKSVKNRICKTIILSFVLYGCETWSLTLR
jgi:hypothetical protein